MKILVFCLFLLGSPFLHASNPLVSYQGRIIKPDGSPLEGNSVQFRMQVRSPGSENCLLYEEVQTINMSSSSGAFSVTLNDGTGARLDTPNYPIDRIFANRDSMTLDSARCSVGTTYTPNAGDGRKFVVYFKDETMNAYEPLPILSLNYAPQAMYALESQKLGTFSINNVLRAVDGSGVPTNAPALDPAQLTNLTNLIAGTSTQYATSTQFSSVQSFAKTVPPTCVGGEVLKSNGTSLSCVVAGATPAYSAITGASTTNTIDNMNFAQTWNWSTATTQDPITLTANALTTGSLLHLSSSSSSLNSTKGLINITNSSSSVNGVLARFQSNSTADSGLTILTNGNVGIGSSTPGAALDIKGTVRISGATSGYTQIRVPASAGTNTLTLPANTGQAGQTISNDGSGNLSWTSVPTMNTISRHSGFSALSGTQNQTLLATAPTGLYRMTAFGKNMTMASSGSGCSIIIRYAFSSEIGTVNAATLANTLSGTAGGVTQGTYTFYHADPSLDIGVQIQRTPGSCVGDDYRYDIVLELLKQF
ncbi:MAG: hypothetical protein JNL11_11460 [Bdellovibrionaceae bacterium]|nr:hypothetical protein [Pseudobdellovibrionaceae bacterium]